MIYPHLSLYNVVNGGETDGGEKLAAKANCNSPSTSGTWNLSL